MDVISYTNARQNLKDLMDKVAEDRAPVTITRGGNASVVMMSLEEYEAMEATLHLIRSPQNAQRLAQGMESLSQKRMVRKTLAELKAHEH